jgi:hypothetical protein
VRARLYDFLTDLLTRVGPDRLTPPLAAAAARAAERCIKFGRHEGLAKARWGPWRRPFGFSQCQPAVFTLRKIPHDGDSHTLWNVQSGRLLLLRRAGTKIADAWPLQATGPSARGGARLSQPRLPHPPVPPLSRRVAALCVVSLLLQWQLGGTLPPGCPPFVADPLDKARETRCAGGGAGAGAAAVMCVHSCVSPVCL